MIWPCKDTAVSMKSDVHRHPPCGSARVPEKGQDKAVFYSVQDIPNSHCFGGRVIKQVQFQLALAHAFSYCIRFSAHLPHTLSLLLILSRK